MVFCETEACWACACGATTVAWAQDGHSDSVVDTERRGWWTGMLGCCRRRLGCWTPGMRCRVGTVDDNPVAGIRLGAAERSQAAFASSATAVVAIAHTPSAVGCWDDRSATTMKHDAVVRNIDVLPSTPLSGVFSGVVRWLKMHWLKKGAAIVWHFRRTAPPRGGRATRSTGSSPLPAPAASPRLPANDSSFVRPLLCCPLCPCHFCPRQN